MKNIVTSSLLLAAFGASAQNADFSQLVNTNGASGGPEALLSCGNNTAYQQPLDDANFNTARTADVELGFTAHESMVDGGGIITPMINGNSDSMRLWGLSLELDPNVGFIGDCTDDNTALTPFNLTFSDDNGGQPGNVIASVTATVDNVVETGIPFAFTSIQETNLSFPETDMTNVAWVSVQRQVGQGTAGGNQCVFLWADETAVSYDDSSLTDDGTTFTQQPSDQTMCLNEALPPQVVPTLKWYSILALLLAIGLFSTRLLVNSKN